MLSNKIVFLLLRFKIRTRGPTRGLKVEDLRGVQN